MLLLFFFWFGFVFNIEHAGIWYAFKNTPGLVCIEAVVKVLGVATDGLKTVVIVGDGSALLEKKERKY